jgi:hypothetical protein
MKIAAIIPAAGLGTRMGRFSAERAGTSRKQFMLLDGAPILLRNNAGRQNHWVGLRLVGRKCNIDAIGAKLTYRSGDFQRACYKFGGGSYLSAHDPRLVLGLGQRTKIDWLEVKWPQPSGATERFTDLPIDRYITIVEGEGKWK